MTSPPFERGDIIRQHGAPPMWLWRVVEVCSDGRLRLQVLDNTPVTVVVLYPEQFEKVDGDDITSV